MRVVPAIDLLGGECVRLRQGDYDQKTVFAKDPVTVAQRWEAEGAEWLHLVDLDGAKAGHPVNTEVVRRIVRETKLSCQLGGGLRTVEAVLAALELGLDRVILGTQAVRDRVWFAEMAARLPGKLILGLDARDGMVRTEGWLEGTPIAAVELARWAAELPLAGIIYTDIAKDGMMAGPNFASTAEVKGATTLPVFASGGIRSEEDVLRIGELGIDGCILGRTIYEGSMKLSSLLSRIRQGTGSGVEPDASRGANA